MHLCSESIGLRNDGIFLLTLLVLFICLQAHSLLVLADRNFHALAHNAIMVVFCTHGSIMTILLLWLRSVRRSIALFDLHLKEELQENTGHFLILSTSRAKHERTQGVQPHNGLLIGYSRYQQSVNEARF